MFLLSRSRIVSNKVTIVSGLILPGFVLTMMPGLLGVISMW